LAKNILINQYETIPTGPIIYIRTKGTKTSLREILCLNASLETHEPKKIFIDMKCSQKMSRKFSDANIVYRWSIPKYNLKIFITGSSKRIIWYKVYT